MSFSLGIVGLPNVGKSTLFNVLSQAKAQVSNYPFCTISPNVGVVEVQDERLYQIQKFIGSPKALPTVIEFVDLAGLVKGAHQGEGLGNQFLSYLREVDAILEVVRCFKEEKIPHLPGEVNPKRDIEIINLELALADLKTVEKRMENLHDQAKSGDQKSTKELECLAKLKEELNQGKPLRLFSLSEEEKQTILPLKLLTLKPLIYLANTDEAKNPQEVEAIKKIAQVEKAKAVSLCAKFEAEIGELSLAEAKEYRQAIGMEEGGIFQLIHTSYELLDLITFFTANEKEARAWTLKRGNTALQAAGKIHSDMEKGFITAEVIHYQILITCQSYTQAKERGLVRSEGKNYCVQDGDLLRIKFVV